MTLEPRDWLLLLLAECDNHPLDPVRVMKGMFLHDQKSGISSQESYAFEPYSYGPFCKEIYRDLESLESDGLVQFTTADSRRDYRECSSHGLQIATALRKQPDRQQLESLRAIKQRITRLTFTQLLKEVYEEYPNYAVNSVMRESMA